MKKTTDSKRGVTEELHKPARINFIRRRVIVKGVNETLQADLVEMIPYSRINKQYKYILVVIDVFSKFVWAKPVKTKTGKDITTAMDSILSSMKTKPKHVQTDLGKEFYNSSFQELMMKYQINHYSTFSAMKASIVERVNRTLKSKMWKEFSYQGTYHWLDILPKIVKDYNASVHSTIKMRPIDVNRKNEKRLLKTIYNKEKKVNINSIKFKEGDKVRISKHRSLFEKGYTPNWTTEVFTVKNVRLTNPITYILEDEHGEAIRGTFYMEELQRTVYPDVYLIEKIERRKGTKLYVKWLGLNTKSWINKKDLV